MARSVLAAPHFHNEDAAFAYVEKTLWPDGAYCPHCGATGDHVRRLKGKTTRKGLHKCYGLPGSPSPSGSGPSSNPRICPCICGCKSST